jgi:hypothetical protein
MNKGETPHFLDCSPENIWLYRQNDPKLVVRDLKEVYPDIDETVVERSLMARGINKWLKVRRDLIAHKKSLKNEIKALMLEISEHKAKLKEVYTTNKQVISGEKTVYELSDYYVAQTNYLKDKEKLKFLQNERGVLKGLCMTERWQDWRGKSVEDMNTIKASG